MSYDLNLHSEVTQSRENSSTSKLISDGFGKKDEDRTRDEPIESSNSKVSGEDASKVVPKSPTNDVHDNVIAWKGEGRDGETSEYMETSGEANMEVSLTTDDVIRAGGFGARDDIGSFLPVASDSTDFEASIRDARDYEEPQGDIHRPGLGWREASEREKL
ncbi:hypothetical protein Gohar_022052 [Gossypium harknessii]|uniref:Uncharacterized protein n=1 Tax=Gossypium harknessii TaxID=34285 RepID=A0A7J9IAK9_9ROSI|nr:hypothetical protein [Gossypium harknessii]